MTQPARPLLAPVLTTVVMVLILAGLGTWQVVRLQWKLGILAQIEAGERAAPMPLGPAPAPFAKVMVSGRFLNDKAAFYGTAVRDVRGAPVLGTQQIVPLARADGPPILVDRGWVPDSGPPPAAPSGEVTVVGYVRPGEPAHWFTPQADLAARRFYALDPAAISLGVGLPMPEPFVLVSLGEAAPGVFPIPAQHLPRPPNNHLSYAITWYGLAITAIVIFIVWLRKRPAA